MKNINEFKKGSSYYIIPLSADGGSTRRSRWIKAKFDGENLVASDGFHWSVKYLLDNVSSSKIANIVSA